MGSGKSTVARHVAKLLNWEKIDMDKRIECRFFKSIKNLFAERGEEGFRRVERSMLEEVSGMENVVVSTGGGAPCYADNMDLMLKTGKVVYLKLTPEKLAERLSSPQAVASRPVLQGKSGDELLAHIKGQLDARSAFYERATWVLDLTDETPEEVAQLIVERIGDRS